jgi:hypothetical protein
MVKEPWRLAPEVFAETEYLTVPLPVPEAPDVMLIQLAPVVTAAVQEHPVGDVTFTVALPPV